LHLQQRDVALVIAANQFGLKLTPIVQLYADFIGLTDNMIVGQNITFGRINNDARTQTFKRLRLLVGRLIAKIFFSVLQVRVDFVMPCLLPARSLPQAELFPALAQGLELPPGRVPGKAGRQMQGRTPREITRHLTL
jgi:hypothetical protein